MGKPAKLLAVFSNSYTIYVCNERKIAFDIYLLLEAVFKTHQFFNWTLGPVTTNFYWTSYIIIGPPKKEMTRNSKILPDMRAGQYCCLLDLLIYYLVRSDANFNAEDEGGAYKFFYL